MGFGKKKKKNAQQGAPIPAVSSVKVDMKHNPLYPPKKESDLKEVLSAMGTVAVSLLLVGLIISKFSYINRMDTYGANRMQTQMYYDEDTQDPAAEESVTDDIENLDTGDLDTENPDTEDDKESDTKRIGDESEKEEQQEQKAEENKEYILADSNTRYISESDLANLSAQELSCARNEIYARHGRRFKDAELQSYFDGKSWYNGTIEPDQFPEGMLNEYEKKNAETILAFERAKGYK